MISGMEGIYELPYSDSVTLSVQEAVYADYQWFVDRGDDYGSVELEGETSAAYTLPELEPSMNGWMYRCAVMEDDGTEEGIYTLADPVTLRLTGEGVPDPVTEHEVGSVEELTAALERVVAGDWYWHTLKLTGDIEYPLPISLTGVVTIDLGNYTLKVLPRPDAQPNIDPEGDTPKVAAIYVYGHGFLETKGDGQLNVIAGEGVDYGVYARDDSTINVHNVTLEDGGNAVLATWGGIVNVDSVAVAGEKAIGVECFDGGNVSVAENITVSGDSSYGIYMSSGNYFSQSVCVGGDVRISGANSRGTYLDDENAELTVNGNVSVNGGTGGVLAGQGNVEIGGGISAPGDAVNAWYGASVTVQGDAVATGKEATAVNSSGADVHIQGNVTSSGQDGTGIYAAAWDLFDPAEGAKVTVDGQISAATPLWIENFPVEENEYVQETTKVTLPILTEQILSGSGPELRGQRTLTQSPLIKMAEIRKQAPRSKKQSQALRSAHCPRRLPDRVTPSLAGTRKPTEAAPLLRQLRKSPIPLPCMRNGEKTVPAAVAIHPTAAEEQVLLWKHPKRRQMLKEIRRLLPQQLQLP
jgi:hypothetical protein